MIKLVIRTDNGDHGITFWREAPDSLRTVPRAETVRLVRWWGWRDRTSRCAPPQPQRTSDSAIEAALRRAWDNGNAVGLNGWVDPAGEAPDAAAAEVRQECVAAELGNLANAAESQAERTPQVFRSRIFNLILYSTTDHALAQRSRFRWWDDGSGTYRLRLRGVLPLHWISRSARPLSDTVPNRIDPHNEKRN